MRLIDADALKTERGMADRCENCKHDVRMCQFNQDYTRMDICGMLDDAPTIDAIPVDWIIETQKSASCGDSLDCGISELLELWQKEREATA